MRISLEELKRAVLWIEANSRDIKVEVSPESGSRLHLSCFDRNDSQVEITLFEDSSMLPKIKKTEVLR